MYIYISSRSALFPDNKKVWLFQKAHVAQNLPKLHDENWWDETVEMSGLVTAHYWQKSVGWYLGYRSVGDFMWCPTFCLNNMKNHIEELQLDEMTYWYGNGQKSIYPVEQKINSILRLQIRVAITRSPMGQCSGLEAGWKLRKVFSLRTSSRKECESWKSSVFQVWLVSLFFPNA